MKTKQNDMGIQYDTKTVIDRGHRKVHSETVARLGELEASAYGVATCHPDDTFDPSFGRLLARLRSERAAAILISQKLEAESTRLARLHHKAVERMFDATDTANDISTILVSLVESTKHRK